MPLRPILLIFALIASTVALAHLQVKPSGPQVIGRLGTTTRNAPIYFGPSKNSRVLYRAKPQESLVVSPAKVKGWLRVALNNGLHGYVEQPRVRQLPFEVTYAPPPAKEAVKGITAITAAKIRRAAKIAEEWLRKDVRMDRPRRMKSHELVRAIFREARHELPRDLKSQARMGQPVKHLEHLRAGDRLYFAMGTGTRISHVGIFLGHGEFIPLAPRGGKVQIEFLSVRGGDGLVGAGRIKHSKTLFRIKWTTVILLKPYGVGGSQSCRGAGSGTKGAR